MATSTLVDLTDIFYHLGLVHFEYGFPSCIVCKFCPVTFEQNILKLEISALLASGVAYIPKVYITYTVENVALYQVDISMSNCSSCLDHFP